MALLPKDGQAETYLQVTFPEQPPQIPVSATRDNPELARFNDEMREWWFSVRTNLRRLQERLGQPSTGGLSQTGVIPGTYGKND